MKKETPEVEKPAAEKPKTTNPVASTKPPVKTTVVPTVKKPATTTTNKAKTPGKKDVAKTTDKEKQVEKPVVKPKITDRPVDTIATKPIITQTPIKVPTNVPAILKTRSNELMKSLVVHDPNVVVKLFDNGEIDDDSISVYLDKKLILSNKKLGTAPIIVHLKMDEENPDHELVMVAENLGRIPPNTSLMVVEAGSQTFEVRITSTEQKNALVRFRYEKPSL